MIRARLPNPDLRLRPGMLMTVSIEASPRDRLGVPELAVVSEGETRYVFVIGADGKVARTAVKTGTRQNGLVEVTEGLRRGQRRSEERRGGKECVSTVRCGGGQDHK